MTLRHFKIFIAVCDTMNMTAASKLLFMSQSAVSQAIAELEKYYELKLFERLSKKLYLTQAGKKLLSYARHMIRMSEEVEKDMRSLQESGSVRIGASVTIGAHVLPKLIGEFQRILPQIQIEVFEDNTEMIEKMILDDEIDIGLVEGEIQSFDINRHSFMEDELVLICGSKHRFAGRNAIGTAELSGEKFILREKGSGTRKLFEDTMGANQLTWNSSWTCNNADTIKMAVSECLGISLISERAVSSEVAAGLLCQMKIEGMQFKRQFKIVYHKNKYITKSMEQFVDLCSSLVDSNKKLW